MEEEPRYTLVVKKKRIAVTEEVYKAYYKHKEREKYLDKLAEEKHISLEACNQNGVQVEYLFACLQEPIEDKLIKVEMIRKMMLCLELLDAEERWLIDALYFQGKSESQIAGQIGITQQAVHKRKTKILTKLKKLIEI